MAPELDQFFHHNPPTTERLLRDLFVGREWELRKIAERIPGAPDTPGIRAIHGNSRVGKSHLAMRGLINIDPARYQYFPIKAAGGRTARMILQELYERVRWALLNVSDPIELEEEVSSQGILDDAKLAIQQFDQLVTGEDVSRKLVYQKSFEETSAYNLVAKLFGLVKVVGVEGSISATAKQGSVETVERVLAVPSEWRIGDIVAELVGLLRIVTGKRSVVYVDDIDLLDAGSALDQEQVVLLVRILERMSQSHDISVVASLRTRHMQISDKGLLEVVSVDPLSDEDLKSAYERHIKLFNDGKPIFDADCLEQLAQLAAGQIGNFLRSCRTFYDWADKRGLTTRLLGIKDLERYVQGEVQKLAAQTPEYRGYIEKIKEAVRDGRTSVVLDEAVLATPLVFTILQEPLGTARTTQFDIRPLAALAIRGMV